MLLGSGAQGRSHEEKADNKLFKLISIENLLHDRFFHILGLFIFKIKLSG